MYKKANSLPLVAKLQLGFLGFLVAIISIWPQFALAETITFAGNPLTDSDRVGTASLFYVAQSFTPSVNADTVIPSFYATVFSSPTDNLVAAIYSDSGGQPGTLIGSSQLSHSALAADCSTINTWPSISASLTASTVYWVVLYRSGSADATNDYKACLADGTTIKQSPPAISWSNYIYGYWVGNLVTSSGGGGGGGGGGASFMISTTTQLVDNPAQNMFNGMVLLIVGFFGTIWFFRRPR